MNKAKKDRQTDRNAIIVEERAFITKNRKSNSAKEMHILADLHFCHSLYTLHYIKVI